ncbi:hypothetical protein DOC35_19315 [Salmonella enterica subsp. enterica]|nr:hypothetical protein [Salmonella enterica subsp. enterica]
MSKLFKIATTAATFALIVATVSPAHAISEAYRKQLQREHKTQVSEIAEVEAANTKKFTGGENGMYEIITDKQCHIKTINGFAPKRLQPHNGKVTVTAQTGDKFEVDAKHCRIFWNNDGALTPLEQE